MEEIVWYVATTLGIWLVGGIPVVLIFRSCRHDAVNIYTVLFLLAWSFLLSVEKYRVAVVVNMELDDPTTYKNMLSALEFCGSFLFVGALILFPIAAYQTYLRTTRSPSKPKEYAHHKNILASELEVETPARPMFCPHCGNHRVENEPFCTYCGTKIEE